MTSFFKILGAMDSNKYVTPFCILLVNGTFPLNQNIIPGEAHINVEKASIIQGDIAWDLHPMIILLTSKP